MEVKHFALTCTHQSVPVRAVTASPNISATLWSEKHRLAGPFISHLSPPLSRLRAAQEGCRAERPKWPLEPLLCGQGGTMPRLVVARAPVSTQEREDASGEFGS